MNKEEKLSRFTMLAYELQQDTKVFIIPVTKLIFIERPEDVYEKFFIPYTYGIYSAFRWNGKIGLPKFVYIDEDCELTGMEWLVLRFIQKYTTYVNIVDLHPLELPGNIEKEENLSIFHRIINRFRKRERV